MRKALCKGVFGLVAVLTGCAASAQSYPDHPIKLIVGIGAGSSTDAISRLIGRKLADRLAQPVVVENRPGAGGTLGAEAGAKAPPDGYTLLSATSSIPIFRHTYTLRFDPEKDLIPVGGVAKGAMVLIVRGDDKAPTVAELIARAKAKPQSVSYGSAGIGSNAHLASEVFAQIAGVEFLHVPYKSSAAGMTDLLGGQVDFIFDALATVQPFIKSKAAKGLAVTTTERSSFLPDVPTMNEAGIRGFSHPVWYAVFAPAGTSREVVDRLSVEIRDIVAQASFREDLAKFGVEPFPALSEALAQQIRNESDAWARKVKAMKLQPQ
jgi:tripartite-type tricarboxylate transporter receptor subunit TctC